MQVSIFFILCVQLLIHLIVMGYVKIYTVHNFWFIWVRMCPFRAQLFNACALVIFCHYVKFIFLIQLNFIKNYALDIYNSLETKNEVMVIT